MHVCMREREDREERRVKDERIEGGGGKEYYTQSDGKNWNHDFQMNSKLLLMEIACSNYKS